MNKPEIEEGFYWVDGKLQAEDEPVIARFRGGRWELMGYEGSVRADEPVILGRIDPPKKIDPILNKLDDDGETH